MSKNAMQVVESNRGIAAELLMQVGPALIREFARMAIVEDYRSTLFDDQLIKIRPRPATIEEMTLADCFFIKAQNKLSKAEVMLLAATEEESFIRLHPRSSLSSKWRFFAYGSVGKCLAVPIKGSQNIKSLRKHLLDFWLVRHS
jgi:hypothetical protein